MDVGCAAGAADVVDELPDSAWPTPCLIPGSTVAAVDPPPSLEPQAAATNPVINTAARAARVSFFVGLICSPNLTLCLGATAGPGHRVTLVTS
ncbi:MAG: hypothetical protein QOJ19_3519 [Acidimicrobiia bacterium]|nr:hypothetical protein [Acidimicrobiia bacterium]